MDSARRRRIPAGLRRAQPDLHERSPSSLCRLRRFRTRRWSRSRPPRPPSQSRMCASASSRRHVCRAPARRAARHRCGSAAPPARTSRRRRCIRRTATEPRAPKRARHSVHNSSMRAISASRSGFGGVRGRRRAHSSAIVSAASRSRRAFRRMPSAPRRARRGPSASRAPASSQAYSQIASESQIEQVAMRSTGTRRVGLSAPMARANSGVSSGNTRSSNRARGASSESRAAATTTSNSCCPWSAAIRSSASPVTSRHDTCHAPGRRARDLLRSRQHAVGGRAGAGARGAHSRRLAGAAVPEDPGALLPGGHARGARRAARASIPTRRTISPICAARRSRARPRRWATSAPWRTKRSRCGTRRATQCVPFAEVVPALEKLQGALSPRHAQQWQCRSRDDRARAPF